MAKKPGNNIAKFPAHKAPSEAEVKGEYVVPVDQQSAIRDLDKTGAELQKQLGALRMDFLMREAQILQQFQQNRQAYEKTVTEVAENAGINLKAAAEKKQPWSFDLNNMTFRRPQATAQAEAPQSLQ